MLYGGIGPSLSIHQCCEINEMSVSFVSLGKFCFLSSRHAADIGCHVEPSKAFKGPQQLQCGRILQTSLDISARIDLMHG